jgi:hypothetical protein
MASTTASRSSLAFFWLHPASLLREKKSKNKTKNHQQGDESSDLTHWDFMQRRVERIKIMGRIGKNLVG